jgi:hypothetical protein
MALNLNELIELALLDGMVDHPVSLRKLMANGSAWHELSGRNDVAPMMPTILYRLLDEGHCFVCDTLAAPEDGQLTGSDGRMCLDKALGNESLHDSTELHTTESGKQHYKKLAHRYYNG